MRILIIASVFLLLLGCLSQQPQAQTPGGDALEAPPSELQALTPQQAVLLDSFQSSSPLQIGAMGEITYNLGTETVKTYSYESSLGYDELLSSYKRDFGEWKLSSMKVRKKDSSPIAVALSLGLSALRNYTSVTFIYTKEGCDYQFCPRLGVTVVSGDKPKVSVSCVSYELNKEDFTAYVEEENRAKQESMELGNMEVGSLVDAQAVIDANKGVCEAPG